MEEDLQDMVRHLLLVPMYEVKFYISQGFEY